MQPLSGNQRPDLLTSLMNISLVLRLPCEIHLCRPPSNVPRLPSFLDMPQNPHVLLTFGRVENPLRLPHKTTLQRPKAAQTCGALYILTSKCASRHNGVHFFDVSTSKSAPRLKCFVHFDFDMYFAPQRRALFRHLNFQKWSDVGVLCTFWLRNVLHAATACTFSSLIWPHGSAPALRSHKSLEKHEASQLSYLFARLHLLSSHSFSSLIFSLLLFSSLTLPTFAAPSVHIVRSLTSKLPSNRFSYSILETLAALRACRREAWQKVQALKMSTSNPRKGCNDWSWSAH